jgi:hypothetical protein
MGKKLQSRNWWFWIATCDYRRAYATIGDNMDRMGISFGQIIMTTPQPHQILWIVRDMISTCVYSSEKSNMASWEISINGNGNRKVIYKPRIFYCRVWLREGSGWYFRLATVSQYDWFKKENMNLYNYSMSKMLHGSWLECICCYDAKCSSIIPSIWNPLNMNPPNWWWTWA